MYSFYRREVAVSQTTRKLNGANSCTRWTTGGCASVAAVAAVAGNWGQSAKLNGRDPWAYLKDVLTLLPTELNSQIEQLLPHKWQPAD